MTMIRISIFIALVFVAATASAKQFGRKERLQREYPLKANGAVVIQNLFGSISVVGTDGGPVSIVADKVVIAADSDARDDGMRLTQPEFGGNERVRVIKTLLPFQRDPRWSSVVNYSVRMPRTASLKIVAESSAHIQINDLRGAVYVKNVSGPITLDKVTGTVVVETINGSIVMNAPARAIANITLVSVNGTIQVNAPNDVNYQWEGEVVRGDARTTFPARVQMAGTRFRGLLNGPGGPVLRTETFTGNVYLLRNGTREDAAQSVRSLPAPQGVVRPNVTGFFKWVTTLGDIAVGDIDGDADISTGAGEIRLGSVSGRCNVFSAGGPLNLGAITGLLTARTDGGDVSVQSARGGGTLSTGGGIIRLLFAGGPTRLASGGGDIVVRKTTGPVNAETRSGDINITLDAGLKSRKVWAKTAKGNVVLNVPAQFGADVDIVVLTTDPDANQIRTDFGNLSIQRSQVGGKTRIHATGKVNGGGERVELFAEDGGVQMLTSPIVAAAPR